MYTSCMSFVHCTLAMTLFLLYTRLVKCTCVYTHSYHTHYKTHVMGGS